MSETILTRRTIINQGGPDVAKKLEQNKLTSIEVEKYVGRLQEKTLSEGKIARYFVFFLCMASGLISIILTYIIEQKGAYSSLGMYANLFSGLGCLYVGYRMLYNHDVPIKNIRTLEQEQFVDTDRAKALLDDVDDLKKKLSMEPQQQQQTSLTFRARLQKKMQELDKAHLKQEFDSFVQTQTNASVGLMQQVQGKLEAWKIDKFLQGWRMLAVCSIPLCMTFAALRFQYDNMNAFELILPGILACLAVFSEAVAVVLGETHAELNTAFKMLYEAKKMQ